MNTPPPELPVTEINKDDKNLALLCHLLTFCGYVIPFANIVGPLIIFLIKKDQSPFIREHAVEALNFQISLTIYAIISAVLVFVLIGILLLAAVGIVGIVFTIIAAISASEGKIYRYPVTIRLVS